MSLIPDPLVHAKHFHNNLPTAALAVDEPWWFAVLALGADCINVHTPTPHRGPLAVIARDQRRFDRMRDQEALAAILRGQQRPTFDVWGIPSANGQMVGLVDVVDCMDDRTAAGLWFVGPYALKVEKPCMLPFGPAGAGLAAMREGLQPVDAGAQRSIDYRLTAMANRQMHPGAQHRR